MQPPRVQPVSVVVVTAARAVTVVATAAVTVATVAVANAVPVARSNPPTTTFLKPVLRDWLF